MTELYVQRIDARLPEAQQALAELRQRLSPDGDVISSKGREITQRVFGQPLPPAQVVQRICDEVRTKGESAVRYYTQQLDGKLLGPGSLRLDERLLQQAHSEASPDFLDCIRRIRSNINAFQTAIRHQSTSLTSAAGIRLDHRYQPLRRVGVCVPGGAAAYPSTVLMTVIPAQVAGVSEIAVVAPPTPYGAYNSDVLATCYELGIREVYPVGGAQAVAALAYGVDSLPAVDKIVGPGNLYVALAKKLVYGQVDIDSIAGPSEVVVIADESARPDFVAADMLAQAEHSPGASLLITWRQEMIDHVERELIRQLATLSRHELTRESLKDFGAFLLVRDVDQAIELTNWIGPEHLHIDCYQSRSVSDRIGNAGAIFLGPFSPVALGDYAAGPSHVLPTGGTARWAAGLSCNSFLRSCSVIEYSQAALADIAPQIRMLAEKEGLTAHRHSVTIRESS